MNSALSPISTPSTLDRVFEAANRLYDEANRQSFPTVDAVRKLAKVNMSDASSGMKSWRRQQTTQVTPVGTIVPELLQQTSTAALVNLWSQAVELANSTLRAAQAGWDEERFEAETLREQIASAYESQCMELESAHAEIQSLRNELQAAQTEQSELRSALEQTRKDEALTRSALQRSEARAIEIERRAEDLHGELERAHTELSELRNAQLVYRQGQDEKVNQLSIQVTHLEQQSETREKDLRHTIDALNRATANFQKRIDLVSPPNTLPSSVPAKSRSPKKT